MIPTPPTAKPVAFFDTECYRNFWVLKIRVRGGPAYTFTAPLNFEDAARVRYLFMIFTVVSFNGRYYDVPMITAALLGWDTSQLKWLSDEIIVNERKPWELNLPEEWIPTDHIDLIEVAPGAGSQKTYAGRIHCKTMQDLPYDPNAILTDDEIRLTSLYCEHDLEVLSELFVALSPQLEIREQLGRQYGLDLRSKSDAQLAEAVLKRRCEEVTGVRIYKPDVDWNLRFRYEPPAFLSFTSPQLLYAFDTINSSMFRLGSSGAVEMPTQLEALEIKLGSSVYKIGIGGLHSQEKCRVLRTNETHILITIDVESYYPNLMINSGRVPKALGAAFIQEFSALKDERLKDKKRQKEFEKKGIDAKNPANAEAYAAYCGNEGKKIMINGTFGKTGSPYSVLFAPEMMIQTTITGQLAILMLIEWFEYYGIPVVSANTDGIDIYCPRIHIDLANYLIKEWETRTGLKMESGEYEAIYARDINNYFAVKADGEVKRKGEYSKAGLVEKKNPDVEICADAVADYLSKGIPIVYTVASCRDLRKFVTVRKVAGGAIKLWGEGARKETKVIEMTSTLLAYGFIKDGRKWKKNNQLYAARDAYVTCFVPQRPEYVGKVIRWYYSSQAPGPIVYSNSGNTVSLSYGAKPCMTLPDAFPDDIDYSWYIANAEGMLGDIGL